MVQTVLAYILTAGATGWIVWSVLLPKTFKRRLRDRFGRRRSSASTRAAKGGCGKDCGCAD